MNHLLTRTFTGVLFVFVMLGAVWLGEWTTAALFLLISLTGQVEFARLFDKNLRITDVWPDLLAGTLVFGLVFLIFSGYLPESYGLWLPVILIFRLSVFLRKHRSSTVAAASQSLLGIFYLPVCLAFTSTASQTSANDPFALTGLLIIIWLYDTGAYLSGTVAGRTPLLPRISPKKTVEGVAGGVLLALFTAFLWGSLAAGQEVGLWLLAAPAIIVAATLGDLFESWLKRAQGVKDSGSILPGHGGVLDRFDALLFAGPVFHAVLRFL